MKKCICSKRDGVYYLLNKSTESTEYKVIVNKDLDSTNYELYRIGDGWAEMAKDEACCIINDHGNGVNTSVIPDMGYCEFQEFYLLCKFIFSYDKTIGDKYTIL